MNKLVLLLITCLLNVFVTVAQTSCGDRFKSYIFTDDEIEVTQNVQYGSNATMMGVDKVLKFDFYNVKNDTLAKKPLIIWAHGGSFIGGNEDVPDIVAMSNDFAKRGYACASMNYRIIDDFFAVFANPTPTYYTAVVMAVHDMKACVRFFRKHAEEYKIDPNQIFVGGASAGGFTAIHTAYIDTEEGIPAEVLDILNQNGGLEGTSGNDGYSSAVKGVINLCGAIKDVNWIQAGEEPIVSVHGTADGTVPYADGNALDLVPVQGSASIKTRMDELGIYNDLQTIQGGDHMAHALPENFPNTVKFVADFLYPLVDCSSTVSSPTLTKPLTNIEITPNPANTSSIIKLNGFENTNTNISIFTIEGKMITSFNTNKTTIALPINQLKSGTYIVKAYNKKQNTQKKLIVQ